MTPEQRKQISILAIRYWEDNYEELELTYVNPNEDDSNDIGDGRVELEMDGRILLNPTGSEIQTLLRDGTEGNWRTRQVLNLVLYALLEDYDIFIESFEDASTDEYIPSREDVEEVFSDPPVDYFLPLERNTIAWDVHEEDEEGFTELIDTVFYSADTPREEVRRSLIDRDGYSSNISLRMSR